METPSPHYRAARAAAQILRDEGFDAYIIGGAVRDLLLGIPPKDFDLATNATPDQLLQLKDFSRSHYQDTAQAFGITRVYVTIKHGDKTQEIELEIATYRQDIQAHLGRKQTKVEFAPTLQDDLSRRDFTINALALDPSTDQVIDLVGGLDDLGSKLIRFIGDGTRRVLEDPLRILRGIRLRAQLGFDYEQTTRDAISSAITEGKLQSIAHERIKTEVTRMLMDGNRRRALQDLDEFDALTQLLPEVAATKGIAQPESIHAEGDVFTHTLLAMDYLPDIVSPRLAWATLLHDIGKARTQVAAEDTGDRIRFSGHHRAGGELARELLARLGFSKRFIEEVVWMVHYHMAIDDLPHMRPRRAQQFMHQPAFSDLLELHKADAQAAWSKLPDGSIDKSPADFSQLENMWRDHQVNRHQYPPSLKRDLDIDGAWLMHHLNLSSGPRIGELLDALEQAYLSHEIHSQEEALSYARTWLKQLS